MNRLYEKTKLGFALVWIGLYVVLLSFADNLSTELGMQKLITAPLCMAMSAAIWFWLRKNNLVQKYGLCAFSGNGRIYLYFLPLVLIVSVNLWHGAALNMSVHETLLYMLSMIFVGFLEEVIFRGFLFRALMDAGNSHAIWISGVTFGVGHIVNLLNGAAFLPTLMQVCYAAAIGILFTVLYYRSGSLLPCIITHSAINALSAIAREVHSVDVPAALFLMVVPLAYAAWIWKKA